jgi:hypothetical protein
VGSVELKSASLSSLGTDSLSVVKLSSLLKLNSGNFFYKGGDREDWKIEVGAAELLAAKI